MRISGSIITSAGTKPVSNVLRALPLCLAVGLAMAAGTAHASVVTYTLDQSNFAGSGTFGTVTLTDGTGTGVGGNGISTGTVQVSESLSPYVFASTRAAYSLEFTLSGSPAITTSDISNLSFSGGSLATSSYNLILSPTKPNNSSLSGFGVAIDCTGCGTGMTSYNSLVFDLAGFSASDFIQNTSDTAYFLSDIGNPENGNTGYAWTNTPGTTTNVPEPGSLALLGAGLLGLGFVTWRRKRRALPLA